MNPTEPYIFWTYPWDVTPTLVKQMNPKYTLCQIDSSSLKLTCDGDILSLNLNEIESCKRWLFSGGGPLTGVTWAELTFPKDVTFQKHHLTINRLYISAMNPLTGFKNDIETRRIIDVINSLREGTIPTIHPNPYYRALIGAKRGDEFSEDKWDPTKPPPTYSTMPNWKSALPTLAIIGVIIALVTLIVLADYIFGLS